MKSVIESHIANLAAGTINYDEVAENLIGEGWMEKAKSLGSDALGAIGATTGKVGKAISDKLIDKKDPSKGKLSRTLSSIAHTLNPMSDIGQGNRNADTAHREKQMNQLLGGGAIAAAALGGGYLAKKGMEVLSPTSPEEQAMIHQQRMMKKMKQR